MLELTAYGALADGSDCTAHFRAALADLPTNGGALHVAAGTYKITSPLALPPRTKIVGDGAYGTVIQQAGLDSALIGVDVERITLEGIGITGPGLKAAYTADGIAFTRKNNPATALVMMRDVVVQQWRGNGIAISNPIVSTFDHVVSEVNGGHGFYLHGVSGGAAGTSTALTACFAVANQKAGYCLDTMCYSALTACASDKNAVGYLINACQGVALMACGAEDTLTSGASFLVTGASRGVTLESCWAYNAPAAPFQIRGVSEARIAGCVSNSPLAGADSLTLVDSTSTVL